MLVLAAGAAAAAHVDGLTAPVLARVVLWTDLSVPTLGFHVYLPGFGSRVLARRVLSPTELERRDANLVGGAVNGGTAQIHQQVIFRPTPGLARAETPIAGLYLVWIAAGLAMSATLYEPAFATVTEPSPVPEPSSALLIGAGVEPARRPVRIARSSTSR